jgi:trans-aconitate 2-methyltransferase
MAKEWNSAEYDRLSDPQYRWGLKVVQKLKTRGLRGDEHVLDAGCGTGRVTAELLEAFPGIHVLAVDASHNMVEQALNNLRRFGARLEAGQLDLLDLNTEQRFDVIFSTAVFHWIKDHDRLFANLFRALRPGGLLLAQCGGGPNLKRLRERTRETMALPQFAEFFKNWERVWEYPSPEVTAERLKRAGFVSVHTELEEAPATLEDEGIFRRFLTTVTLHPYLDRIPPEFRERFLDPIARQAAQDRPPFTLDYWRLNLEGRKPGQRSGDRA